MERIGSASMTIQSITAPINLLQFHNPRSPFHFHVVSPPTTLRKLRTTTFSLADDTTLSTTTKVAVKDSSLEVKKTASDLLSGLKGTSIFLVGKHFLMLRSGFGPLNLMLILILICMLIHVYTMIIFFIFKGMDNSIKTSLGKLLADALRYYYFDSDSLVLEAAGGESEAKAFKESDEKGYREAETEVLKQLSSMGRLVVCAGNGAVQSSTNLALLRHGISIWIDVPLDMAASGVVEDQSELPASELSAAYKELRDRYAIADATISVQKVANQLGYDDLDAVTTEDMAMEVLKEIEKLTRVKRLMEEAARPF
ncbi:hypothetical protein Dsin_031149 [Dipteronia sinensis]|uniref:Inactive shikimate kinase like 1, chloroplastic n=1 Tax=Dipteronia sinensis TaxID=43782 RepID=A0AAD9ZKM8_9ROSI|nr:hypothetical protein Dsin_031149 [Dipteronia sinensis]